MSSFANKIEQKIDNQIYINYIFYINYIVKELSVTHDEIFKLIVSAVNSAPRNQQTAELHIQMIKYADQLKTIKETKASLK